MDVPFQVDGNRQVDEVFEDVKAIFAQLNNQVTPIFLSVWNL